MATLFSDNFNRANAEVVDATNWVENPANDWDIVSNEVQCGTASPPAFMLTTTSAHAAVADVAVSVTRRTGAGFDGGVVAREQNGTGATCYYLDCYGTNNVEIYRRVGGSDTLVDSRNTTHADNDVYRMEVTGTGATVTIKVFKNGVQMGADIADTNGSRIVAAGQTGILSWGGAPMQYDDFLVEDFAGSPASITGTGAATNPAATASGTAVRRLASSPTIAITPATAAGTAIRRVTGTGAITTGLPTVEGEGDVTGASEEITGTGALSNPAATSSGTGTRHVLDLPGEIALTGPVATLSGEGTVEAASDGVTGTGAATIAPATSVGTGKRGSLGTGAIALSIATTSGTAVRRIQGSGTVVISLPTVAGTEGPQAILGTGAIVCGLPQLEGTGVRHITGTGALSSVRPIIVASVAGAGGGVEMSKMPAKAPARKPTRKYAHGRRGQWQS